MINPSESASLTIDFDEYMLMTEGYEDVIVIYSGNIKILNASICNANETIETDEPDTCIYIRDANVTFENCYALTFSDDSIGYYITGDFTVSLNGCGFSDVSAVSNGEISQTNVIGCLTDSYAALALNDCAILTSDGIGVISYGTTTIKDSYISAISKNSQAIIALEGGTVNINDGYYYGNPALFVYDIDSSVKSYKLK